MPTIEELQKQADLTFLALVVWREARGESKLCKVAVAYSIMNRVANPSWWGRSVTGVLFKKWQYSSMTDPHDRQLITWPDATSESWKECLEVSDVVLHGAVHNPVPGADSYYDDSISPPKWATKDTFVAKIDHIIFHNLDHDYEAPDMARLEDAKGMRRKGNDEDAR